MTKIKKDLSYNPQNFVLLAFRTGTCNCDVIDICFQKLHLLKSASQVALVVKNLPANAGDTRGVGSIPGLGRSPGGRHDNPFQYSCLENPQRQRGLAGYSPWGHKELDSWSNLACTGTFVSVVRSCSRRVVKIDFIHQPWTTCHWFLTLQSS